MSKFQRVYLHAFVIAMVLCWSPFNMMAYIAPFIVLAWIVLFTNSGIIVRNIFIISIAWLLLILLYWIVYRDFIPGNGLIAYITYGAFLPILAIPSRYLANRELLWKVSRVLAVVVIFESALGFIQALYGTTQTGGFDLANGDYVEGTVHPSLGAEGSFSNPIFAVLMAMSIAFLISYYYLNQGKGKASLVAGIMVFVIASVMHVTLFFLAAFVISYLLYRPRLSLKGRRRKGRFIVVSVVLLIPLLMGLVLSSNVRNINFYAIQLASQQFPKTVVMTRFFTEVTERYPIAPYIGLGPGQYVSRASLISTGMYFGGPFAEKKVPIPFGAKSDAFARYVEDLWLIPFIEEGWVGGSTLKPQSSWNGTISEFGVIGFAIITLLIIKIILKVRRRLETNEDRMLAFSFGIAIILLFLLGFQENYWEVTQAIFIALLLMKIAYAILIHSKATLSPNVARN